MQKTFESSKSKNWNHKFEESNMSGKLNFDNNFNYLLYCLL